MRAGDGVHFTMDGADYLARTVFKLVDAQCAVTAQKVERCDEAGHRDRGQHPGRTGLGVLVRLGVVVGLGLLLRRLRLGLLLRRFGLVGRDRRDHAARARTGDRSADHRARDHDPDRATADGSDDAGIPWERDAEPVIEVGRR